MVQLHFKKTEGNEFLYDTTMPTSIDQLLEELCESKSHAIKFLIIFAPSEQFEAQA